MTGFRLEFDFELEALPGDRDVRDVRGCPVDRHLIIGGGHLEDMVVGQPGLPIPTKTRVGARRSERPTDELPDELAAELGVLLARIERAIRAVGVIGRVHVCRWGDGSEHLHWWFMARPARMPQLLGSFAAIWDDILPPVPEDVWRANLATVADAVAAESN
jgi:diadenosine tetraphosphate (Ap4A) HIT family hydrolase